MSNRITVMLDDDVIKKLRAIQAEKIKKSSGIVSFSSVIDEVLRKCV